MLDIHTEDFDKMTLSKETFHDNKEITINGKIKRKL